jgi:plasmid stability protein
VKKAAKTTRAAKHGKPTTLPAAEWAFHRVPFEQWEAATNYEYQREAALLLNPKGSTAKELRQFWQFWVSANGLPARTSPKGQDPWFGLPRSVRSALTIKAASWAQVKTDGVRDPLTEMLSGETRPPNSAFLERVVFVIDWRARDAALVKRFAAWVAEARKKKRGFLPEMRPANKTGPKDSSPALCDLVIWRCRRAGLSMKATAELVHPFLQHAGGIGKVINPIQRARACQNAEKRIRATAQSFMWMFNNLPTFRPAENWIALARGERVPSIIEQMGPHGGRLNKVPKRNRGK